MILFSYRYAAAAAKSLQSCPTLCDHIDGSPPGSPIPGILQLRTLEWVAISFSNAGKWKVKVKSLSRARLLVTPWTAAHQDPLPMGFSRQEYWSGVPLPSPVEVSWLDHRKEGFPWWLSGKESTCHCRRHEMWVRSLGQEDPLEESMATHSNISVFLSFPGGGSGKEPSMLST